MASLLLCLLLLPAPASLPDTGAEPAPLIRAIDLDVGALLADPSPLAADTLVLLVEASREADYRLEEQGEVLAAGKLLPGRNSLRFARPGLSSRSQELAILFELLEAGAITRKTIRVILTVAPGAGTRSRGERRIIRFFHAGDVPLRPPVRLPEKGHGRSPEIEDRPRDAGARPGFERRRRPQPRRRQLGLADQPGHGAGQIPVREKGGKKTAGARGRVAKEEADHGHPSRPARDPDRDRVADRMNDTGNANLRSLPGNPYGRIDSDSFKTPRSSAG